MHILSPACLHEIGRRTNNEDAIYPSKGEATTNTRLFLVCDGVGGAAKGEVASTLACKTLSNLLANRPTVSEADIQAAITATYDALEAYVEANPASKGMACTLTLLHFSADGATIAHLGDSRVYHLRAGKIVSVTRDHSLVMDMVVAGILSAEQAAEHPKRNVINRALVSSGDRKEATIAKISDVQPGDRFFLCTDGVLESVSDAMLCEILFRPGLTDNQRIDEINQRCLEASYDNYSCYLVQVE